MRWSASAVLSLSPIHWEKALNAAPPVIECTGRRVLTWHAVQRAILWGRRRWRGQQNRWEDSRGACRRQLSRFTVAGAGFDVPCPGLGHLLVHLLQLLLLDHLPVLGGLLLLLLKDTHTHTDDLSFPRGANIPIQASHRCCLDRFLPPGSEQ